MARHGKTFAWASRLLTRESRHDAAVLYAFARYADDLADNDDVATQSERDHALQQLTRDITTGERRTALTRAVIELAVRRDIPTALLLHFLQSIIADNGPRSIASEHELMRYAYGVAGTVGVMMRPILGAAAAADRHAATLGLAMQLTNIARDVEEDARRGRIYLPAEYFAEPATADDILTDRQGARTHAFSALCRVLALADVLYADAARGFDDLPGRNRLAIMTAARLYRHIGVNILRDGPDRYWGHRAHVTRAQKAALTARALTGAALNQRPFLRPFVAIAPQTVAAHLSTSLSGLPGVRWPTASHAGD